MQPSYFSFSISGVILLEVVVVAGLCRLLVQEGDGSVSAAHISDQLLQSGLDFLLIFQRAADDDGLEFLIDGALHSLGGAGVVESDQAALGACHVLQELVDLLVNQRRGSAEELLLLGTADGLHRNHHRQRPADQPIGGQVQFLSLPFALSLFS